MTYSYRDIIKLKYPNKTVQRYVNETYEGIIWNSLDSSVKPTKEELDQAILDQERIVANEVSGSLMLSVKVSAMTGTSLIPYDNTIPLITEGTEILRVTFKPTNALNKLLVTGSLVINSSSANRNITLALFKDNNCIGVSTVNFISSGRLQNLSFSFTDPDLGLSYGQESPVYTLRVGANSSTTWYVNRSNNSLFNNLLENNCITFLGFN